MESLHRLCRALLAALVLFLLVRPALAKSIIPPGREQQVLALVQAALAEQSETPQYNVSIEQDLLRVRLGSAPPVTLVVRKPAETSPTDLAAGVTLECPTQCSESQRRRWLPLARRLAQERNTRGHEIWAAPALPPAGPHQLDWKDVRPRAAHLLFAFGFARLAVGELDTQAPVLGHQPDVVVVEASGRTAPGFHSRRSGVGAARGLCRVRSLSHERHASARAQQLRGAVGLCFQRLV